jgi:hypothetical protein
MEETSPSGVAEVILNITSATPKGEVSLMADRKSPIQRLYYFHGGVQNITSATPKGEVSLMADRKSPIQRLYYFHGGVQNIVAEVMF